MLKAILILLSALALSNASYLNASPILSLQSALAARTVTTTVQANSSGEAVVKAQKSYPKGQVTGVRKTGGKDSKTWIVTLRIE